MLGFLVRGHPDLASPSKARKVGYLPGSQALRASVTIVLKRIEVHLLCLWQIT